MSVGADWLLAQGEDAKLLYVGATAFFSDDPTHIGVAVSGGSDSMAMLHVLARVASQTGWSVSAVTVDHGLRPEAAAEARFVSETCATLGVTHDILRWERTQTSGNLQDQAARARYRLIAGWAKDKAITHVTIGHTADDQAETFIMRLARRSGIDGLSGMRHVWTECGMRFRRPFLLWERADLRAYLMRNGLRWIEDPSNANDRFERVKTRKVLVHLAKLGITTDVLTDVTLHLSQAQDALDAFTRDVARQIVGQVLGDVTIDWRKFQTTPPELQRRLLIAALQWVSGAIYPPRSTAMQALEMAITSQKGRTLSGCWMTCVDGTVRISREHKAVRDVKGRTDQLWDRRWLLNGPHAPGLEVGALGAAGLKLCPDWRATGMPRTSLAASPAVWQGETLIAAPLAGFNDAWTARIVTDFHASLLSH